MKIILLQILLFFFLIVKIHSNFTVFAPMGDILKISYGIANFGDIPYGKKISG